MYFRHTAQLSKMTAQGIRQKERKEKMEEANIPDWYIEEGKKNSFSAAKAHFFRHI